MEHKVTEEISIEGSAGKYLTINNEAGSHVTVNITHNYTYPEWFSLANFDRLLAAIQGR